MGERWDWNGGKQGDLTKTARSNKDSESLGYDGGRGGERKSGGRRNGWVGAEGAAGGGRGGGDEKVAET